LALDLGLELHRGEAKLACDLERDDRVVLVGDVGSVFVGGLRQPPALESSSLASPPGANLPDS
jgi:hypothetical protein